MSETNTELSLLRQRLKDAEHYLKLDEISDRKLELEDLVAQPDLWDDAETVSYTHLTLPTKA